MHLNVDVLYEHKCKFNAIMFLTWLMVGLAIIKEIL